MENSNVGPSSHDAKTQQITSLDYLKSAQAFGARPATSSIVILPTTITNQDLESLQDIHLIHTYVNAYAFQMMYNENHKAYDISDPIQAAEFTRCAAKYLNIAITKGMGSFLSITSSTKKSFSKTVTSASLHAELLGVLFESFSLPEAAMREVDGVLSTIFKNLKDISVSVSSESKSVDHMLFIYYLESVKGLENVKVAKLRVFFLHVDNEAWKASVSGKGSVEEFKFEMNYVDINGEINGEIVQQKREQVTKLVENFTKTEFSIIRELTSATVVQARSEIIY